MTFWIIWILLGMLRITQLSQGYPSPYPQVSRAMHEKVILWQGARANAVFSSRTTTMTPTKSLSLSLQDFFRTKMFAENDEGSSRMEQRLEQMSSASRMFTSTTSNSSSLTPSPQTPTLMELPPRLDLVVCASYICFISVLTTPVVLTPVVIAELPKEVVPYLASMAVLGAALGKLVNGFICRQLGAIRSLQIYATCMSVGALLYSGSNSLGRTEITTSSLRGLDFDFDGVMFQFLEPFLSSAWSTPVTLGAMEFFGSICWVACCMLFSERYGVDEEGRSNAVGRMGLCSTLSQLLTKIGGSALLTWGGLDWRDVARVSAFVGLLGVTLVTLVVSNEVANNNDKDVHFTFKEDQNDQTVYKADGVMTPVSVPASDILRSLLFWKVGAAHSTAFLVRTCDRVLGSFYSDATGLPRSICGGLTSSVTLGFALGAAASPAEDWTNRYVGSFLAAVALAACAFVLGTSSTETEGNWIGAVAIALSSGAMAAFIAGQFYRLPSRFAVSRSFISSERVNGNKQRIKPPTEICIAWIDCLGFGTGVPIWGAVMAHPGGDGWTVTWLGLAAALALGGKLMMGALPELRDKEQLALNEEQVILSETEREMLRKAYDKVHNEVIQLDYECNNSAVVTEPEGHIQRKFQK